MLSLLLPIVLLAPQPIRLSRTFVLGEKLSYRVQATMQVQARARHLDTWMPEDLTVKYDFSTLVKQMKADGIAVLRYQRPLLTVIDDDGQDSGPDRQVEKLNWDKLLTVSPLNKILDVKDTNPKSKTAMLHRLGASSQENPLADYVGEVYRLALFTGGIDTSLDFSPPLPIREVAPGDTWKATVSYQPQKLKGKADKTVVQRLDYTYTYSGLLKSNGRMVQRVVGELNLDTDLAPFFNDMNEDDSQNNALSRLPLKLKTRIDFDLDPKTLKTLTARATASGSLQLFVAKYPDEPVEEVKLAGGTTMSLVGGIANK